MAQPLRDQARLLTTVCILFSCLVSVGAALVFHRDDAHASIYGLANLVGGTADGLLHGRGMTVTTDAQGTAEPLLYHAARMPVATLTVAAGTLLFGEHGMRAVALFKTVLFLIPVWLSMTLALRWPETPAHRTAGALLLLLPFASLPFLADVVNLQVEEGYSYAALAFAFALLLFPSHAHDRSVLTRFVLPFAFAVNLLYLSKSSMLPAVIILLLFAMVHVRITSARVLLLLLVLAAPLGWAMHQKMASSRVSLGTSLDGLNLHKGENPGFLHRYPPAPGDSLDRYDAELSSSRRFASEWAFNDFHQHAAVDFIRHDPAGALRGSVRKASIFFFSLRKVGSSEPSSHTMALLETAGIVVMRCTLWAAILWSATRLFNRRSSRSLALLFLLLIAACAAPYLLGFAYTRHVSILLYPSILLLCRFIAPSTGTRST